MSDKAWPFSSLFGRFFESEIPLFLAIGVSFVYFIPGMSFLTQVFIDNFFLILTFDYFWPSRFINFELSYFIYYIIFVFMLVLISLLHRITIFALKKNTESIYFIFSSVLFFIYSLSVICGYMMQLLNFFYVYIDSG